ncbi:MAG: heat-inducible transcriptional repressor HrcA [Oscillospiraceae bacterium]|nr:heat-inducible transcriptional repressor HrcA [Oscillospiraceae bacterium]
MDERKRRILAAVVDAYILTGEPVGSKAIAALPDIRVSPATIRNDMAMLEQLGYLEQPHTSAGRIPTYSGYRLYIDELMNAKTLSDEEKTLLDNCLDVDVPTADALIESASKALAELTHCATVVKNVAPKFSVITKVELIPTGRRMYVLLMVTSSGNIKNKVCRLEFDLTNEQIEFFSRYMAENLQGVSIEDLDGDTIDRLVSAMGAYMVTLAPLLQGVCELAEGFKDNEVKLQGEKNLLARQDINSDQIVEFFENRNKVVKNMLDDSFGDLQVLFGEDGGFIIENSSMIVSKIKKDGKTAGSLGVIGPMRLDYAKIIPYLEYLTDRITDIISDGEPPQAESPPSEKQ